MTKRKFSSDQRTLPPQVEVLELPLLVERFVRHGWAGGPPCRCLYGKDGVVGFDEVQHGVEWWQTHRFSEVFLAGLGRRLSELIIEWRTHDYLRFADRSMESLAFRPDRRLDRRLRALEAALVEATGSRGHGFLGRGRPGPSDIGLHGLSIHTYFIVSEHEGRGISAVRTWDVHRRCRLARIIHGIGWDRITDG